MIRRNIGGSTATAASGTANQENNMFRQKATDHTSGAVRPPMRFALGEIKNTQQQPLVKRTTSMKTTRADDIGGTKAESKVEPRRPLRSTATTNLSNIPLGKHVEQKPVRAASKLSTSNIGNVSSNNSSLNGTTSTFVSNKSKAGISAVSKIGALAANGKGRLLRSNAMSSLHTAAASVCVSGDGSMISTEISELAALEAALQMSPLKEENENVVTDSPARDFAYSSSMVPLTNIDAGDEDDPQSLAHYVSDIYKYLRILEKQQSIKENFLDGKEVTGRMRSVLIDWLVQVHLRFHLLPETMYMTVAMIDRFLQDVSVPKEKLQLVGVTAMFVASKYEEMYGPDIGDFSYITDNSCSKQDIRCMECALLRALKFRLGRPLPIHFLRRYSKAAEADAITHTLAKYFLELALIQYPLAHFPPSILAAAALWLSLKLQKPDFKWSPTLIYYSNYREADFMPCLRRLCRTVYRTHRGEIKQQVVRNKFSTSKFFEISKHPCLDLETIRKYSESD